MVSSAGQAEEAMIGMRDGSGGLIGSEPAVDRPADRKDIEKQATEPPGKRLGGDS
jgi:hypothetical protein